jgi:O-antigen/teichoic acid export membrane protein
MPKENKYLKNTIILSIGKFATQFIAIVLLPLFTRYLSTSDYGYIDLIQTYINLFIPLFLLCFDTAVFRFFS